MSSERGGRPLPVKPFNFEAQPWPGPGWLDEVPLWLRLPGEPGYVEMDANMRPVIKRTEK